MVLKQLQQVNYDLTHLHGERSEQYRDLKSKEQAMKGLLITVVCFITFLLSFCYFSCRIF